MWDPSNWLLDKYFPIEPGLPQSVLHISSLVARNPNQTCIYEQFVTARQEGFRITLKWYKIWSGWNTTLASYRLTNMLFRSIRL
jgi:hypothetical protein